MRSGTTYLAGILIGIVTALLVRIVVWPGMDMVIAMLLGTALGMAVHLVLGLILSPLLGMFETMVSASLVRMYGGMLFAMRDSMAAGSTTYPTAIAVGAVFGALVVLGVKVYDRALRGTVLDAGI